ncbi:hypothetical protein SAMN05660297_00310 [Natronincola peptidivorans]|uniref:Uncharacterized protein n=1 Tax=Natronincola peptidivorans TaxID=426128 RepID=A0A1H9YMP4_9FIRM|nr:hypothetical protein [Natronincola peptidivorans]SES70327.1 hypothetical protein SAMN05660297_00310 [Natronincola peptidivorans]
MENLLQKVKDAKKYILSKTNETPQIGLMFGSGLGSLVIVPRHGGLKVLGIPCVTDMPIPDKLESISHEEVMEVANKTKPKFIGLVKEILSEVNV